MTINVRPSGHSQSGATTRRAAYSLAAGAAACMAATEAEAVVVYSGLENISIGQFSSQNLNIDGDAYNDILLKNYVFGGGNYQGAGVNFAPGLVAGFFANNFGYVSALSAFDTIDGMTVGPGFAGSMAFGANNPNAEFNSVSNAFIGLSFPSGSDTYFGWVRVAIDNAAGTFVIKDWAYNDLTEPPATGVTQAITGPGIQAGDTGDGFVPEPGTLGLLAAGAVGVAGLRRRRRTTSEN
jgi:hypothetical protein